MSYSLNECVKMEEDVAECGSERKLLRRLDSGDHHILNMVMKPPNAEDVERTQLDLNHNRSSNFGILPAVVPPSTKFNHLCWSHNCPIPQFGPKKFEGFSSSIAGSSDNSGNYLGYGNCVTKSTIFDEPEPMQIDEACYDEANSPSEISCDMYSSHNLSPSITSSNNSVVYKANRKAEKSANGVKRKKQELIIPRHSTRFLKIRLSRPD